MGSNPVGGANLRQGYGWLRQAEAWQGCAPKPWRRRAVPIEHDALCSLRALDGFAVRFLWTLRMDTKLYYVYLLGSLKFPDQTYVGFSADVEARIKEHNRGGSIHAAKYRPWALVCYHAFTDIRKAKEFEAYLKSGSGRAFSRHHLW